MDQYQIKQYVVEREVEREKMIDPLLALLPKRKAKGSEMALLVEAIKTSHALLVIYDGQPNAPAIAGSIETAFIDALGRLSDTAEALGLYPKDATTAPTQTPAS